MSEIRSGAADAPVEAAAEAVLVEAPVAAAAVPASVAIRAPDSALRRAQATNIVERYTTYSALGGCLPVALVDSFSVGLIIFGMVRALANHYQVPFKQDQVKASVAALIGGVASPSLGSLATHLLGSIVPGTWLVRSAASSAAAAAFTRYSGLAFVEHFESGGTALDIDIAGLRGIFRQQAAS
jgi:hypothetical protein